MPYSLILHPFSHVHLDLLILPSYHPISQAIWFFSIFLIKLSFEASQISSFSLPLPVIFAIILPLSLI